MAIKYLGAKRVSGLVGAKTPAEVGSVYGHFDSSVQASASAWNDQSGNSFNLAVTGASLVTAGQNGYDYLSFDGTNDTAIKSSGMADQATGGFTWAYVGRLPANDASNIRCLIRTTGGSSTYMKITGGTVSNSVRVETPYVSPDETTWSESGYRGQWAVLIFTFTHGDKVRTYAGNASEAVELKTTSTTDYDNGTNIVGLGTGWWLGVNGGNANQYADFQTGEVISFNKALSATEVSQLGAHLLYKWGVTSTNPKEKASLLQTTIQGYDGGDIGASPSSAAGGGGAGEVGESQTSGQAGGDGGDGLQNDITGTNTYYAGGGGGAPHTGADGSGGQGGGGDANRGSDGDAGTANTGGGGGGAGEQPSNSDGGAGGSGIVIVRFLTSGNSYSTSGSPTVTTDGSYTVVKYLSSGTFTPAGSFNLEYLVVGGGGSGGGGIGGGGGAGGYLAATGYGVTAQSYTVTVGAGGAKQTGSNDLSGVNGANSVFGSITALGGGFGSGELQGSSGDKNGGDGASGGGAAGSNRLGGDGTSTTTSNLPAGSIFIETDTYKYFGLSSTKDRWLSESAGDYKTGIIAGGYTGATRNETDIWENGVWTAGGVLPTGRASTMVGGGKSNGISGGGGNGGVSTNAAQTYNGSSWSSAGTWSTARTGASGGGNSSDAITCGGFTEPNSGTPQAHTQEYDGTSWASAVALSQVLRSHGGGGNTTSAFVVGGYNGSSYGNATDKYNGTTWSNSGLGTISASPTGIGGGAEGNGTDGIATNYTSTAAQTFNGTNWATIGSISASRNDGMVGGNSSLAFTAGGVVSSAYTITSEKYNGSTWASTGSISVARGYASGGLA